MSNSRKNWKDLKNIKIKTNSGSQSKYDEDKENFNVMNKFGISKKIILTEKDREFGKDITTYYTNDAGVIIAENKDYTANDNKHKQSLSKFCAKNTANSTHIETFTFSKKEANCPRIQIPNSTRIIPNHPNTTKNKDTTVNGSNFFNPCLTQTNQYDKNMKINSYLPHKKNNTSMNLDYPCTSHDLHGAIIQNRQKPFEITKGKQCHAGLIKLDESKSKASSKSKSKLIKPGSTLNISNIVTCLKLKNKRDNNIDSNSNIVLNENYFSNNISTGTNSISNVNSHNENQTQKFENPPVTEFTCIENIDIKKKDENKLNENIYKESVYLIQQELVEYSEEIFNSLKEEESINKYMIRYGYMQTQNDINEQMRAILVDWLIDVHSKFSLKPETLFLTVNLIDKYLTVEVIPRTTLQLLGICSMLIACKHEEIFCPHVRDFVYITDKAYSKEEVLKMEQEILKTVNYIILTPSPLRFFEFISFFFRFSMQQFMFGRYLLEVSLIDYRMIKYSASIIACSCAYITMKFFNFKDYNLIYTPFFCSGNSPNLIKDCARELCYMIDNSSEYNLTAAKRKFSKKEFMEVSNIKFS